MTVVLMVVTGSTGGNWVEGEVVVVGWRMGRRGGFEGVQEWKNTISPAPLQCLSSQLVTLKHQS